MKWTRHNKEASEDFTTSYEGWECPFCGHTHGSEYADPECSGDGMTFRQVCRQCGLSFDVECNHTVTWHGSKPDYDTEDTCAHGIPTHDWCGHCASLFASTPRG